MQKKIIPYKMDLLEERLDEIERLFGVDDEDYSQNINEDGELCGSHPLYEMAHKGDTPDGIEIWVYSSEGPVPHIHFVKKRGDRKTGVNGCLSLKDASYFNHGSGYKATLNRSELSDLIDYLSAMETDDDGFSTGLTNYEACCKLWNYNNDKHKMKRQQMPDYSVLFGKKE